MYAQCWTGRESAKTFTSHSGVDVVVIVVVDVVVVVVLFCLLPWRIAPPANELESKPPLG